jgi:murein DD-endopeptidase MepM/ murein hydrolase activator NlpD
MARIKYYYDTETCRYERVRTSNADVAINALGLLFLCMVFGAVFALLYSIYFPSERELALMTENRELLEQYERLNKDIQETQQMLAYLQERDDDIYRVIFEQDPIPAQIRQAGVGGINRYSDLLELNLSQEELIVKTRQKIDKLKRQMYVQTKSYDELSKLAMAKNEMLASIPAIQPVANKDLKRFSSGFGMRIHPIYKVRKMHAGVDFSAPTGSHVFATGNGRVVSVEYSRSNHGYGNSIEIDHGHNYVTKYAHLSRMDVRVGQVVKRGQIIGEVGNTGGSVAPHLHYEVIYKGRKIDPANFFFNDLTPEQYEEIMRQASLETQSFER